MNLFVCPGAPSPARVRLYLAEKNARQPVIRVTEVTVDLQAGEQRQAAHLARNPIGRVPVLEVGDGVFISESLAIISTLKSVFQSLRCSAARPLSARGCVNWTGSPSCACCFPSADSPI